MLGLVDVYKPLVRSVRCRAGTGTEAFSIPQEQPVYAACAKSTFSTTSARLIKRRSKPSFIGDAGISVSITETTQNYTYFTMNNKKQDVNWHTGDNDYN